MLAEKNFRIDKDSELDEVYVNFMNAPFDNNLELDTEEIEDGIYRVYDENKPFITYRYTILDFSYNNREHLEKLTGISLKDV
ncbi:hypothetical protein ACWEYQ_01850 [Staphylococcus xylosus]